MSFVCLSFVFTLRYNFVSVVFDFSASLNDVVPASPISVSVDDDKWKWWIVDGHLLCVFCFHHLNRGLWVLCLILVLHLMMLLLCLQSYYLFTEKGKSELLMDVFCVSSLFCLHNSDRVQWALCLISMIHSRMLLRCISGSFLLEQKKSLLLMDVFFVSSFFCLHLSDWVQWVLCLISVNHSMTLHLCLQCRSLLIERVRIEWFVVGCLLCAFFLLSSPPKLSAMSVLFNFNDSLSDVAPVLHISLSVDEKREKSE